METLEGVEVWTAKNVFPKWAAAYPKPPDVIGVTRKYWPEIDAPVKAACAALTRSVPQEHKQGIKSTLRYLGWKGYKMDGLTPNMTRRAQVGGGTPDHAGRATRDASRSRTAHGVLYINARPATFHSSGFH